MPKVVTVFGGTGFLGRHIVKHLYLRGAHVLVATRTGQTGGIESREGIEYVKADVTDPASITPAISRSDAVANAVSLYEETDTYDFDAVHVEGARNVASAASRHGIDRVVHVSGIGSDSEARSRYISRRGLGENAVWAACPSAVVIRPCVMAGPNDAFLTRIASIVRKSPVFPLFGDGSTLLQPVFVDQVAEAVAECLLSAEEQTTMVHELGGRDVLEYREIVMKVADRIGKHCKLMPVPYAAWAGLGAASQLVPAAKVSQYQIDLMRHDNVVGSGHSGLAAFGIFPMSFDEALDVAMV